MAPANVYMRLIFFDDDGQSIALGDPDNDFKIDNSYLRYSTGDRREGRRHLVRIQLRRLVHPRRLLGAARGRLQRVRPARQRLASPRADREGRPRGAHRFRRHPPGRQPDGQTHLDGRSRARPRLLRARTRPCGRTAAGRAGHRSRPIWTPKPRPTPIRAAWDRSWTPGVTARPRTATSTSCTRWTCATRDWQAAQRRPRLRFLRLDHHDDPADDHDPADQHHDHLVRPPPPWPSTRS